MKKFTLILSLVSFLVCLPACSPVQSTPPVLQTPTIQSFTQAPPTHTLQPPSPTLSPTGPTLTPTIRQNVTEETIPTSTLTPSPTSTPTYDPRTRKTITPVSAAKCPPVNPAYQPVFADPGNDNSVVGLDLSKPILDALNHGASLAALKHAIANVKYNGEPNIYSPDSLFARDVTGDHIPEIIFSNRWFILEICKEGYYEEAMNFLSGLENQLSPAIIADMNQDGLDEILLPNRVVMNYVSEYYFSIFRWDGDTFVDLVPDETSPVRGVAKWSLVDSDHNGTLELVVRNWPPTSQDAEDHGPWRYETYTYSWNGSNFTLRSKKLDPPVYRFQAVQDGDRAMCCQNYKTAITFFKQAISNPDLLGWGYSINDQFQRQQASNDEMMGTPTRTPFPLDPVETPTLISYAHYRLMLAYVALGENNFAKTEYQILQNNYPQGKPGSAYAALARVFWDKYQSSSSISSACQDVERYTQENQADILDPVNNYTMGFQNLSYSPEDLCIN